MVWLESFYFCSLVALMIFVAYFSLFASTSSLKEFFCVTSLSRCIDYKGSFMVLLLIAIAWHCSIGFIDWLGSFLWSHEFDEEACRLSFTSNILLWVTNCFILTVRCLMAFLELVSFGFELVWNFLLSIQNFIFAILV